MGRDKRVNYDAISARVQARELTELLKVSSSLASTLNLAEILRIAIESAVDLLGVETGAIYILESSNLLFLGATVPSLPEKFPNELRLARLEDHPHIHSAISTHAPVFLEDARSADLTASEKVVVESRHLISVLYFPILLQENATGVFIVGTTAAPRQFTDQEIDLCFILSYQVSLAIANAKLYQDAQQAITDLVHAYDATLEGWSGMLDMRDHATEEHTHRVADMTVALAEKMGVPASEIAHIRRGALLHDIGKMGIPDAILQKPGRLSEAEMAIMRTHPEKAWQVLSRIDYLGPAMDIPCCHHEHWDGKGYPRGLKGEQIPLAARIFAVVDVYDALTSDRPYRKAWEPEKALQYIREQAGQYFDPQVVEAFMEMISTGS